MEEPIGKGKNPAGSRQTASRVDTLPDGLQAKLNQAPPAVGEVVGERYRLLRLLGDGAMGSVFVAKNITIDVEVAVKVLRHDLIANPEFRRRFELEAQAIAAVDHPNVARFVDLLLGDPSLLVMEYVRGETLAEVLRKQKRIGPKRATRITIRLCWALDAVHEAGIVHRDLKPGNIMLAPSREVTEVPKIIDFGLAKLAHLSAADAPLTRAGQIVGTPEFMAPEQIAGKEIDARADVYSLGCVLYNMLVGRTPFSGSDDDVQTMYRQLNEAPASAQSQAPGISDALEAVVQRALAKSPAERFPSMQAMAAALEATPEGTEARRSTVAVGTASQPATTAPPPARPRWALPAVVGALVVGAVLGAVAFRGGAGARAAGVPSAAPAPGTGTLLMITTTPPGARVTLDGKPLDETTPLALDELPPGAHELELSAEGFAPVTRTVELAAGGRESLAVMMPPLSRTVTLKTVPSGARVFVDDLLQASSTPATLTLSADEFYQLRVEKPGFQPVIKNLGPEDREPELNLTLDTDPEPVGSLMIVSSSRAQVWIDGRDTGYTTPTVGIRATVGEHHVEIRDAAGNRAAAKVKVEAGVTEQVQLNLDLCE